MKSIVMCFLVSWACVSNAQSLSNKIFGGKNQFETGVTLVNYFNGDGFKGFGYEQAQYNRYLGYSRIIKNKHVIGLSYTYYTSPLNTDLPIGKVIEHRFKAVQLGYGYIFTQNKFQVIGQAAISYRYYGGESIIFGYRNPFSLLSEPLFARLNYNSVGGSVGIDANYFFIKNVGVGIKASYTFYPFENAKLGADGIDKPDPLLVATHRPLNQLFIVNGKLVLRF